MRRILSFWCAVLLSFCLSCKSTQTTKKPREEVFDVSWTNLVRDHQTAVAYRGHKIRFRLDGGDYQIVGQELHVCGMNRNNGPVILCTGSSFKKGGRVTVVGVCREVVRDGVWRSPRTNFYVVVEQCVVTDHSEFP